jgi:hypothetical protein
MTKIGTIIITPLNYELSMLQHFRKNNIGYIHTHTHTHTKPNKSAHIFHTCLGTSENKLIYVSIFHCLFVAALYLHYVGTHLKLTDWGLERW